MSARRWWVVGGVFSALILSCGLTRRALAQNLPACIGGCGGTWGVSVTPDLSQHWYLANAINRTVQFHVQNTGSSADNYTLTCSKTGTVSCVSVVPSFLSLDPSEGDEATVTFNVGASGGLLKLTATGHASATGTTTISVYPAPAVSLVLPALTSGSRAVVRNRQPVIRAIISDTGSGGIDTTATVLKWRGATVTSLARHNRGLIEWEVDSTRWLGVGDSAQVEVKACSTAGACTTVTRWAVLPNDQQPVLGFAGMPFEALGAGFSAPFGPGLSVVGADIESGLSSAPYYSLNAARSAGLVYSSRTSFPRALVQVDLELPWPAGTPDQIKVLLRDNTLVLDSLVQSNTSCATGAVKRCRVALQGDFHGTSFATPTRKWLTVEARVTSGGTTRISIDSVEVVLVDRRTTPYGSGWWPAGISQLASDGDGGRMLIAPNGAATLFRGNGDSLYLSPPGSFTTLVKTATGWELRPRGTSAKVVFDAAGRVIKSVDANANRDTVRYYTSGALAGYVTKLVDPRGFEITFVYDGYSHLYGIQDMTGRTTKMWVNPSYSHLVYDSLSSDPSRPLTTRFDYVIVDSATRTLILTQIRGVIGDTTTVELDSTFYLRPVRVNLPRVPNETGTWLRPQISYTAYERQGYGALRSLDSVYVEVKDPLNHWTRSLPNRWGQARKTWDALGLLAKATYDPDGFLLSSEGKNGDSSRTYTVYDGNKRVVKSYIVRAAGDTLRGDSLVYNSNHWVVKTIDNRGKVDSVAYDASGNVIYHRDPAGNVTRTWYNGAGQVDSVLMPGATKARSFRYDYATGNSWQTYDENGTLVAVAAFDQFGRDTTTDQKIRVQQSGSSYTWQWRRVRRYYNLYNAVDSTALIRTANCTGGCPNPTWPSYADTTKTQHVRYVKDRAGRDSLRVDDRGYATRYRLDRLGRVLVRTPRTTKPTVYDSMAYDLAGNPRKTITRRGHTIVNTYDSRNRLVTTSVPGVGVYRREYQGPLDQLTRIWVDSLVDSIGGVKPDLSWYYDQRGRLKGDTVWTGATARVTTYATDSLERLSTMIDANGTWTTRYETDRGMADTIITPFGDTVTYAFDPQGRAEGPTIRSNGPRLAVSPDWNVTGQLSQLTATVGAGSYSPLTYLMADANEDSLAMPLVPYWLERHGAGAGLDSLRDSVVYDGWERVTQWRGMKKAAGAGSWQSVIRNYTFDRGGNLSTGSGAESYDKITNQLSSHTVGAGTHTNYFDAAGNLDSVRVSVGGQLVERWVYTWDPLNRLIAARHNDTLIVRYAYDVQGRRIAKDVYSSSTGGTTGLTQFVYHGGHVAYEIQGIIKKKYTWGLGTDDLIAVRTGTDTTSHYYAVKDKLGSIRALVKRDGTWVTGTRYGPYGEVLDSAGTSIGLRYGWTGREYDAETGWYYFRARYFDPGQKRFVSEDPIGYGGGGNLYAYVNGAVTEARDPSGLLSQYTSVSGFVGFCTSGGSCLAADGSVTSGSEFYIDGVPVGGNGFNRIGANAIASVTITGNSAFEYTWRGQMAILGLTFRDPASRTEARRCGSQSSTCAALMADLGRQPIPVEVQFSDGQLGRWRTTVPGFDWRDGLTVAVRNAAGTITRIDIVIDPLDFPSNPWGTDGVIQLGHELGHAWGMLSVQDHGWRGDGGEFYALMWENLVRRDLAAGGNLPANFCAVRTSYQWEGGC